MTDAVENQSNPRLLDPPKLTCTACGERQAPDALLNGAVKGRLGKLHGTLSGAVLRFALETAWAKCCLSHAPQHYIHRKSQIPAMKEWESTWLLGSVLCQNESESLSELRVAEPPTPWP